MVLLSMTARNWGGGDLSALLRSALQKADASSHLDLVELFGRPCHIPQGLPVAFGLVKKAESFEQGVRWNIEAGGDSCGRAMIIGPVLGARFGISGEKGIPLEWLLKLNDGARLYDLARKVAG